MTALKVLIADDHALVRAGIRALLEKLPDIVVLAETGDGRSALKLIEQHQPDVVLMDIAMPELNGLEATKQLARRFPALPVIILSMHADEEHVWQALRAGAKGYLLKESSIAELDSAIRTVAEGKTYLSPPVSEPVITDYLRRTTANAESIEGLTARQREILQLIAEGKNTKQIALILGLSAKTVETHRAGLMERLKIKGIPGLVRKAVRMGLVNL